MKATLNTKLLRPYIYEYPQGHTSYVNAITVNPAGTLAASHDKHVRLWRLSDRQTIVIFKHLSLTTCITVFMDDKHILSGGGN
jgi:WD40 repeat protein